jgi:cyclophilin family peptidyl-prolyl cis-trans isomerase
VGTAKRERQKQGRQARLAQAQAEAARRKRFTLGRNIAILVVVVLGVAFAFSALSGDEGDVTATATTVPTSLGATTLPGATTVPGTEGATPPEVTIPPAGASITGETPCPEADGSSPRTTSFEQAPPTCIDASKTYDAIVTTSEGAFTIKLDVANAPITVNNFVVLARYHLYDGIAFHRVVPGFVDQVGDPIGPSPGQGGPGYEIDDELPTGTGAYPEGSVAMANSGPNTGGSQWFVTVEQGGDQLEDLYSRFGTVTDGIDVVQAINALGDATTQRTSRVVTIESIEISEA